MIQVMLVHSVTETNNHLKISVIAIPIYCTSVFIALHSLNILYDYRIFCQFSHLYFCDLPVNVVVFVPVIVTIFQCI